jgi:hypothetical protein
MTINMTANFLSLPSELRNNIYEQLLVLQDPIVCSTHSWFRSFHLGALTPGLLLVNKTVHREASSLLYAQNRFDFTMCIPEYVASFFDQIGRNNANHIRHIYINFPSILNLGEHDATLEEDSIHMLARIQNDCTNLITLRTSLDSTDTAAFELDALDSPKAVVDMLALVDARFRAISSLREVIVEVYEDSVSAHIIDEMKSRGWTVEVTEQVEEPDFERDIIEVEDDRYRFEDDYDNRSDDDYGYGFGHDYHVFDDGFDDDYWRRAGD